ncbi:MAG: hypothetical protein HC806_01150 [Anaerolineae bacterium]|nr:hypothetical protein [Anaerolineae bacterium]
MLKTFTASQRLAPLIAAVRWLRALSSLDPSQWDPYAHAVPSLMRELLENIQGDDL